MACLRYKYRITQNALRPGCEYHSLQHRPYDKYELTLSSFSLLWCCEASCVIQPMICSSLLGCTVCSTSVLDKWMISIYCGTTFCATAKWKQGSVQHGLPWLKVIHPSLPKTGTPWVMWPHLWSYCSVRGIFRYNPACPSYQTTHCHIKQNREQTIWSWFNNPHIYPPITMYETPSHAIA
jgi:hypothetical protein